MSIYTERVVYDIPPVLLPERSIEGVAEYIKSGKAKNIIVMSGAGISTAAGIPDYRTPGTGLYTRLAALNLPYPEAITTMSYFRENPYPYYVRANMIDPDKFSPTFTHYFIRTIHEKGLLLRSFTQNIDTLERKAGVPAEKLVEAHGTLSSQRCIDCELEFPNDLFKEAVRTQTPATCLNKECGGYIKPDTVFFGQSLPKRFFKELQEVRNGDLILVMGTSLQVAPFSQIPNLCNAETPRVLFNKEAVGTLGIRPDDVVYLDTCDNACYLLAKSLGWLEDVERLYGRQYEHAQEALAFLEASKAGTGAEGGGLQKGVVDIVHHYGTANDASVPEPEKLDITPAHAGVVDGLAKRILDMQSAQRDAAE